jgi:predicted ATPase
LSGAGGVGKTRLALEVAARLVDTFADGVWFVDLTPLTDGNSMIQRILDLWRVPDQPGHSLLQMLTTYLRSKELLLILDNCEHLIDACAELAAAILQHCPQVSLLATSREPLNIGAEMSWRVPSLTHPHVHAAWDESPQSLPLTPEKLLRFEAVVLFVGRAQMQKPGFTLTADNAPAVAQICSRLDGIPLALEMAAARVHVFTVEELAARLDGVFDVRFQLLTSGTRTAPLRHQTLRAMLEWSYKLLTPAEQRLLARLSVFVGGWTVAAVEAVLQVDLDQLAQLANKSLVIAEQQGRQTRYRLLETVRQFATEQMQGNEQEQREVQCRHSWYYLHLLGEQEKPLQSQQQRSALEILRADFANISAAWYWAVAQHDFVLLAPAVHALFLYCQVGGHSRQGTMLFASAATELAEAAGKSDQPNLEPLLGKVLARLGVCEAVLDSFTDSVQHLQQALHQITSDWERAFALAYLGLMMFNHGEWLAGLTARQESLALARSCGDPGLTALALDFMSYGGSDFRKSIDYAEESLALWREVGRPDRVGGVLIRLASYQRYIGDYDTAFANLVEGGEICEELGMQNSLAHAFNNLGLVAWCQGDWAIARAYQQKSMDLYDSLGMVSKVGMVLAEMALVLRSSGDIGQSVEVARQAVAILRGTEDEMMTVLSLNYLGAALIGAGNAQAAREALIEAGRRAWADEFIWFLMTTFYYFAELLVLEGSSSSLPNGHEEKALAVTLLTLVFTHRATWQIYKDKAAQLLAQIEGDLPAEVHAAAIARGQSCTVEEMVSTLSWSPLPSSS